LIFSVCFFYPGYLYKSFHYFLFPPTKTIANFLAAPLIHTHFYDRHQMHILQEENYHYLLTQVQLPKNSLFHFFHCSYH